MRTLYLFLLLVLLSMSLPVKAYPVIFVKMKNEVTKHNILLVGDYHLANNGNNVEEFFEIINRIKMKNHDPTQFLIELSQEQIDQYSSQNLEGDLDLDQDPNPSPLLITKLPTYLKNLGRIEIFAIDDYRKIYSRAWPFYEKIIDLISTCDYRKIDNDISAEDLSILRQKMPDEEIIHLLSSVINKFEHDVSQFKGKENYFEAFTVLKQSHVKNYLGSAVSFLLYMKNLSSYQNQDNHFVTKNFPQKVKTLVQGGTYLSYAMPNIEALFSLLLLAQKSPLKTPILFMGAAHIDGRINQEMGILKELKYAKKLSMIELLKKAGYHEVYRTEYRLLTKDDIDLLS